MDERLNRYSGFRFFRLFPRDIQDEFTLILIVEGGFQKMRYKRFIGIHWTLNGPEEFYPTIEEAYMKSCLESNQIIASADWIGTEWSRRNIYYDDIVHGAISMYGVFQKED